MGSSPPRWKTQKQLDKQNFGDVSVQCSLTLKSKKQTSEMYPFAPVVGMAPGDNHQWSNSNNNNNNKPTQGWEAAHASTLNHKS